MSIVRNITSNNPYDTKRKKIITTSADQTFTKARKTRHIVSLIENMINKALLDMEIIWQDRKNDRRTSSKH